MYELTDFILICRRLESSKHSAVWWHTVVRPFEGEVKANYRLYSVHRVGTRNFFHINAPGMDRIQLLNLGGFGLRDSVKVLGSDCNNRFPNTNHNLNHTSNDNLTLNPKSNPKLTMTLTLY